MSHAADEALLAKARKERNHIIKQLKLKHAAELKDDKALSSGKTEPAKVENKKEDDPKAALLG